MQTTPSSLFIIYSYVYTFFDIFQCKKQQNKGFILSIKTRIATVNQSTFQFYTHT